MNESRYRQIEAHLFADAGVQPIERHVLLPSTGTEARILEVGSGAPVVFFHGGPMAAATWAYVVAQLQDRRCVLVERPGCGLSAPLSSAPTAENLAAYVSGLTVDVLDGLGIEAATLVGSSFGGYSALVSAAAFPDRVERVVLAGCPPFVSGWRRPSFFNVLRLPVVGRVFMSLPATKAGARMFFKQMGERAALADGRITDAMLEWTVSWQRDTDTMRNDTPMILACAFDPHCDLGDDEFKAVTAQCLFMAGAQDPVGNETVVTAVANRLPDARVEVWDGAGHLPWHDDPRRAAATIREFTSPS